MCNILIKSKEVPNFSMVLNQLVLLILIYIWKEKVL